MKEAFLKESTQQSDPLIKTFYKSIAASFVNAELISSWVEVAFVAINNLGKTIDKSPNKQRCNASRKEHENQSKRTRKELVEKSFKKTKNNKKLV
jgi:hypothetical protein